MRFIVLFAITDFSWYQFSVVNIENIHSSNSSNNLPLNSNFARLWLVHDSVKRRKANSRFSIDSVDSALEIPTSFFTWIQQLYAVYTTNYDALRMHHLNHLVCGVFWSEIHPAVCIDRSNAADVRLAADALDSQIEQGWIYLSDFTGIIKELAQFGTKANPLRVRTKAIVKGIHFDGRGIEFAEHGVRYDHNLGARSNRAGFRTRQMKECNKILLNWHKNVGSWCSVNDAIQKPSGQWPVYEKYIAQLNYFFRLQLEHDTVLNGVAFIFY